jgi:hypothetical protein
MAHPSRPPSPASTPPSHVRGPRPTLSSFADTSRFGCMRPGFTRHHPSRRCPAKRQLGSTDRWGGQAPALPPCLASRARAGLEAAASRDDDADVTHDHPSQTPALRRPRRPSVQGARVLYRRLAEAGQLRRSRRHQPSFRRLTFLCCCSPCAAPAPAAPRTASASQAAPPPPLPPPPPPPPPSRPPSPPPPSCCPSASKSACTCEQFGGRKGHVVSVAVCCPCLQYLRLVVAPDKRQRLSHQRARAAHRKNGNGRPGGCAANRGGCATAGQRSASHLLQRSC